jgi:ribosomal protein L11 methyltransferase
MTNGPAELHLDGATAAVQTQLWEELDAISVSRDRNGRVVAGFGSVAAAERAAAVVGSGQVVPIDADDRSYLDVWRAWAQPTEVGRLVVRPAWHDPLEVPGTVEIAIDSGHAFGHGGHPSTRLALAAMEARVRGGERVLDVGCGSGVLAIAAVTLGAQWAEAIDIDPVAVNTTRANILANGVRARVEVNCWPLMAVQRTFEVVVANIGVAVLRDLAVSCADRVEVGGWLVFSGLLDHQWEGIVERLPPAYEVEEVLHEDGWAAPVVRRNPATA